MGTEYTVFAENGSIPFGHVISVLNQISSIDIVESSVDFVTFNFPPFDEDRGSWRYDGIIELHDDGSLHVLFHSWRRQEVENLFAHLAATLKRVGVGAVIDDL